MRELAVVVVLLLLISAANAYMDSKNDKDRLGKGRKANTIKDDPNSDNFLPW